MNAYKTHVFAYINSEDFYNIEAFSCVLIKNINFFFLLLHLDNDYNSHNNTNNKKVMQCVLSSRSNRVTFYFIYPNHVKVMTFYVINVFGFTQLK